VQILCHSTFKSSSYQYVFADVLNNTNNTVYNVKLTATFYDAGGAIVGTDYAYCQSDMLAPGERTSVLILLQPSATWTRYEVAIASYQNSTYLSYNHNFVFLGLNDYVQSGWLYVVGEVRNDTNETWTFVEVFVTLYDSAGCIVDTDSSFVASTDLAPGQKSTFSTMFYGTQLSRWDTYMVRAEGWRSNY
jgi:hypothetical protein